MVVTINTGSDSTTLLQHVTGNSQNI